MRVPTILYVSLAVFLTACATADYDDCGVNQTGEHQSFSELARSLKNSKSLERPPNKAAKKLKPIKRPIAAVSSRLVKQGYSGRCDFIFDVDKTGKVINLDIYACSKSFLKLPTIKAVEQWSYEIPIENSQPTIATGIHASMYTKVQDSRGITCPLQEFPT